MNRVKGFDKSPDTVIIGLARKSGGVKVYFVLWSELGEICIHERRLVA